MTTCSDRGDGKAALKVVWLDRNRITVWKDRGTHLKKLFGPNLEGKYALASLERPGLELPSETPFKITNGLQAQENLRKAQEEKIIKFLRERPSEFTKTSAAEKLGGNKSRNLETLARLLEGGTIGPNERGAKISVSE